MGPRSIDPGKRLSTERSLDPDSFNGAAIDRSRKGSLQAARCQAVAPCFNGAAIDRSRKDGRDARLTWPAECASMGPRSMIAERKLEIEALGFD